MVGAGCRATNDENTSFSAKIVYYTLHAVFSWNVDLKHICVWGQLSYENVKNFWLFKLLWICMLFN